MSKVMLDLSSGKGIVFYLDGKCIPSVIRIDNISNLYDSDTLKEVTITLHADEVKMKDVDGNVIDMSDWRTCECQNEKLS